ncbi:MAG: tetratricopeptide repeat protein [Candidatus Omnitrophica bacterium]|jgi:tetratricopeptide (TPR) repeat protein|nr:tetratricopeptide repeat protein [Candidatus Omnitrophota bacterium]
MPSKKTSICVFFSILAVCFTAYGNSISNPFIWDDDALIVKNTSIRNLSLIPELFNDDLFVDSVAGSNFYRPVQSLTYMLDYHFAGLKPPIYHITNILLQTLVGFLVFLLFYMLIDHTAISFAGALLFSVSPLHTEAVTYISGRAEMLLGVFLISSFLFFIKMQDAKKSLRPLLLFLSYAAFILALLSKELAIVFPFIILVYLFIFRKDKSPHYFFKKIWPYFAIAGSYMVLRLFLLNFYTLRPSALMQVPIFIRLIMLPKIIFTYIKLLVYPLGLHMSWELIRPTSVMGITIALIALGLMIFCCFRLLQNTKHKVTAFLLYWSLIFFLPQSGILPINAFVSEHFIYLASIPYFLLLAFLMHKFFSKKLFILLSFGMIIFYMFLTASRNYEWSNPIVFYQKIISVSPSSFQARNNLGLEYEHKGMFKEALKEYQQALRIKPDLIEARSNLANLYFKLGRYADALKEYQAVEKNVPPKKAAELANNIANVLEAEGLYDQALAKYELALKLDPGLCFAHFNLARIYFAKADKPAASQQIYYSLFTKKLPLQDAYLKIISGCLSSSLQVPGAKEFYNNLGVRFAANNLMPQAITCFKQALKLDLDFTDAYFNLGLSALRAGNKKEAVLALRACLRKNPNHLKAKALLSGIQ